MNKRTKKLLMIAVLVIYSTIAFAAIASIRPITAEVTGEAVVATRPITFLIILECVNETLEVEMVANVPVDVSEYQALIEMSQLVDTPDPSGMCIAKSVEILGDTGDE